MSRLLTIFFFIGFSISLSAHHEPWTVTQFPQDEEKRWWDDSWFDDGQMPVPANLKVREEQGSLSLVDKEVPYTVFRPDDKKQYPAVLFMHGRRGIDEFTRRHPRRLAAQGFVVLAPDIFTANFIEKFPIEHDYDIEKDVAASIDELMARRDINSQKACTVSHTRGGYYTLKALVTYGKQKDAIACYVSYYPHWQDPNASEAMQIYRYAPEVNDLEVPVLVFMGEHEQYNRLRPIMFGIEALKESERDPSLIVYPGVGRGFDFRPPNVRSFADELASKDAMLRAAAFIRRHLSAQTQEGNQ
ncbi:MAG: dienelactone hydrolase family protein [bacterium]